MQMTLYTADCCGKEDNAIYPHKRIVKSAEDFKAAVERDHVCAAFADNHRGKDNFIEADCSVMDCDNDHSENPDVDYTGVFGGCFGWCLHCHCAQPS